MNTLWKLKNIVDDPKARCSDVDCAVCASFTLHCRQVELASEAYIIKTMLISLSP